MTDKITDKIIDKITGMIIDNRIIFNMTSNAKMKQTKKTSANVDLKSN